jgi:hypothetical protein
MVVRPAIQKETADKDQAQRHHGPVKAQSADGPSFCLLNIGVKPGRCRGLKQCAHGEIPFREALADRRRVAVAVLIIIYAIPYTCHLQGYLK